MGPARQPVSEPARLAKAFDQDRPARLAASQIVESAGSARGYISSSDLPRVSRIRPPTNRSDTAADTAYNP